MKSFAIGILLLGTLAAHAQEHATQVPPQDQYAPPAGMIVPLASPHWFRWQNGFGMYFVFPKGAPSFCNCTPLPDAEEDQPGKEGD